MPPRGGCVRQEQCGDLLAGSLHCGVRGAARWRRGSDAAGQIAVAVWSIWCQLPSSPAQSLPVCLHHPVALMICLAAS